MPEFLVLLLMQVTIFSSIAAILIIAVKQVFKCRIPPALGMFMWVVLLARLLCPIYPESEISIYNFIPVGRNIMFSLTHDINTEMDVLEEARFEAENPYVIKTETEEASVPVEKETEKSMSLGTYLSEVVTEDGNAKAAENMDKAILLVYLSGIVLCFWRQIYVYQKAKEIAFFKSQLCSDRDLLTIYYNTAFSLGIRASRIPTLREGSTPMLVGCLHPAVVYRKGMGSAEAEMVFAHELNHYKNYDNPILLFSTAVCCMFWYNPLMWIVRHMLREDIEVLCDARTLESCGIESTDYALMLCRNSAFGELSLEAGVGMSASGRRLKTRLKTISIRKKHNYLSRAASALLCAVIIMVCLTNPIVSQSTEYTAYIDNYTSLTGKSERDIHLDDNMTVYKFLSQVSDLLRETGGESLSAAVGSGSLELLKRMVADSGYISTDVKKAADRLKNDESLTVKNCAVLVECLTKLLSGGRTGVEASVPLLPEMIGVEDFNRVLSALTPEEAQRLESCYNRGVRGADVEFDYLYTNAMMELINERINDEWMKSKFKGFYLEVNISPEDLDSVSDWMNETIRYVGIGKKFFICDPSITDNEEKLLREIIGAAMAGEREDVYYLKEHEDGCSFDEAEQMFVKSGYTLAEMFEGYANLGVTLYDYIAPEAYSMISEYDFRKIEERLTDNALLELFYEAFDYYEDFTYRDELGQDVTYDFGYYALNESSAESGEFIMKDIVSRMNELYMPKLYEVDKLTIVGVADDGVRKALVNGMELGIFETDDDTVYLSDKISCGESLRIAYKLRACLVNTISGK